MPGGAAIQLYKNNTDNKGASYGCHENYLMRRAAAFADIVRPLTPFFVSRQVICGAGGVGIGADGRGNGFQISQRADLFEVEVGLETTLKRPIITTRDEPHADPEKYRRLHVIIGDANMSEVSTYLKLGTTALVRAMIEDRFLVADLGLDAPVAELRTVRHDPSCRPLGALPDGRSMTAIQLQVKDLELASKCPSDWCGGGWMRKYREGGGAAGWDAVILDTRGRALWKGVPTLEPLRGTRGHVGDLLDRCETASELVAALTGRD